MDISHGRNCQTAFWHVCAISYSHKPWKSSTCSTFSQALACQVFTILPFKVCCASSLGFNLHFLMTKDVKHFPIVLTIFVCPYAKCFKYFASYHWVFILFHAVRILNVHILDGIVLSATCICKHFMCLCGLNFYSLDTSLRKRNFTFGWNTVYFFIDVKANRSSHTHRFFPVFSYIFCSFNLCT
jgi:hypothetical protein